MWVFRVVFYTSIKALLKKTKTMVHVSDLHNVVISYASVLKYMFCDGLIWLEILHPSTHFSLLDLCMFSGIHIKIALHQENCFKKYRMFSVCFRWFKVFQTVLEIPFMYPNCKLKLRKMLPWGEVNLPRTEDFLRMPVCPLYGPSVYSAEAWMKATTSMSQSQHMWGKYMWYIAN